MAKDYVVEEILQKVQKKTLVYTYCDWCGEEIRCETYEDCADSLTFSTGHSCRDGGYKEGWTVEDLCKECGEKVRKVLEQNGVTVKDYDVDW